MSRESSVNYCHAIVVKNVLSDLHSARIMPYSTAFDTIERLQ